MKDRRATFQLEISENNVIFFPIQVQWLLVKNTWVRRSGQSCRGDPAPSDPTSLLWPWPSLGWTWGWWGLRGGQWPSATFQIWQLLWGSEPRHRIWNSTWLLPLLPKLGDLMQLLNLSELIPSSGCQGWHLLYSWLRTLQSKVSQALGVAWPRKGSLTPKECHEQELYY